VVQQAGLAAETPRARLRTECEETFVSVFRDSSPRLLEDSAAISPDSKRRGEYSVR
jgi:hypothetical protein